MFHVKQLQIRLKDLAEKNKSAFGLLNVLNELCKDVYFYPTQYNDEKDMAAQKAKAGKAAE